MSDFLERLAARAIGLERGIEPVASSIFAPPGVRQKAEISGLGFERDDAISPEAERDGRVGGDGRKLAGDGRDPSLMPKSLSPAGQGRIAGARAEALPHRMPFRKAVEISPLRDGDWDEESAEPIPGPQRPAVGQAPVSEGLRARRAPEGADALSIDEADFPKGVALAVAPDRRMDPMDRSKAPLGSRNPMDRSREPMDRRSKDLIDESRGPDIGPDQAKSDSASIEIRSIEGLVAEGNGSRQGPLVGSLREDDRMALGCPRELGIDSASDDLVQSVRESEFYPAIEADEYPGGRDEGRGLVREGGDKIKTGQNAVLAGSSLGFIDRSSRRPSEGKGDIPGLEGRLSIARWELDRRPPPISTEKAGSKRIIKGGLERMILSESRSSMRRISSPVPGRLEGGPEISVRIGRVEVVAVPPGGPNDRTQSKEKRQPKIFSLDEYLDRRRKGEI